jgi:PAS domain S-box-containing protein
MIWLCTYLGFIIHSTLILFFVPVPLLPYLLITGLCHLLYIACYFFIKNNMAAFSRHWLIITTYITVTVFDHMFSKGAFTYLYLFAFMPSAMNIFSLKRNKIAIITYTVFPLVYTLFTNFFVYNYPAFPLLAKDSALFIKVVNIILVFMLFVAFAGYMILNNLTKHQKLLLQSIGLQTTLDNSAGAIWSIDKDYNLMATNMKYAESLENEFGVTGLKRGVNIKQHIIWEKLPQPLKNQYYEVLSGKDIQHEIELNEKYYEIKGNPIYDMNGKIGGATFGSRDITSKKKSEAALLNAKRVAEDANMAKARFLSNMSHELRTPLNGIIGITRIMQDEKLLPEQLSNFKTLQDLSEHTLQIVNNILDLAKIEAGKATLDSHRFNLKRFIDKIGSLFAGTAQLKGIKFITEIEGQTDIYVKGDEVRLSQVLINLIGNAFKFTDKGTVTFKVETNDNDSEHCMIRFGVTDTGIGIKNESINKIFESFSQADSQTTRSFGGTGLGLSIAEKILALMNSTIKVDSEMGKGSAFRFEILLNKSSYAPLQNNIHMLPDKNELLNMKILLAEDNKVNQIVAARMLEKWKGAVTVACNGKEAAEFVQHNKFDVILMDLDMPVMDGYESVAIIKEEFPEIPVIALTAASFDDMNNFLLNKGFSEVVQKPFVPDDLLNKIMLVTQRA